MHVAGKSEHSKEAFNLLGGPKSRSACIHNFLDGFSFLCVCCTYLTDFLSVLLFFFFLLYSVDIY